MTRYGIALVALLSAAAGVAHARPMRHYIYVNRERAQLRDSTWLSIPAIAGAQVKYTWRELEPARDLYDLTLPRTDLVWLRAHGKGLVVQLQDASFDELVNTPDYLATDSTFHGGSARKYEAQSDDDSKVRFDGWVARRWDPAVSERWARLLQALADSLDGALDAVVLSETAVQFGTTERYQPAGFTPDAYEAGIRTQMAAARHAFQRTPVIQYANFMPGEWLPKRDAGHLRRVAATAESLGVGLGGPDLMPFRKELLAHNYPLIAARPAGILAGVAVQKNDLKALDPATGKPVSVEQTVAFARDTLRLDYVFWGTQEPYFHRDVLPWLRALPSPGAH